MNRKRVVIIGAGGLAREVRWLISEVNQAQETFEFLGYVVSDLGKVGINDSQDQILGDFSWLERHHGALDGVVIGIGTPKSRLSVAEEVRTSFPGMAFPPVVHPTARLHRESCSIEEGAIITAGVIGTVNIVFQMFSLVNLACTIGHESWIGSGSVINPTVNISGGVRIGEGVLLGTGAQVLQYLRIGDYATVGAGAVVTKDVPPGATVVGIPAKELKSSQ